MKLLLLCVFVSTSACVHAMVCFHGICDNLKKTPPPSCKGSVIKKGGFCGCYDVCAKQEGEECQAEFIRGRMPLGTCDEGLVCQHQEHMIIGTGKCVNKAEIKPARNTQTLCQRRRIQSMIVQIVYKGQWFPKCDQDGLFQSQQCDNTGMCFCVDSHSGEVDESTKVLGAANCGANTKQARNTQTLCQRRRIQSMIVQIVYKGQWFPKCDQDGLFQSQQCDNTGMCFCVDTQSGEIDESTKVLGAANCGAVTKQARNTQTLCQRRRIQSMIVQIVYKGQWFPKCDQDGLFQSQQCDNTGMCFCVDIHSGEIDESTKVLGAANCGAVTKQARDTQTVCEQRRAHSFLSMLVYKGQWFPKCDAMGLFLAEQCDNAGTCFCVDVHSGVVDESTKGPGSANCVKS